MKNAKKRSFLTIFLPSVLLQILAALLFLILQSSIEQGDYFFWQFAVFLLISMTISLSLPFLSKGIPVLLCIRFFIIFLIGYPMADNLTVELVLMLSLLVETALFIPPHWNLPVLIIADLVYLSFQKPLNAFHSDLPAPPVEELLIYIIVTLTVIVLLYFISVFQQIRRKQSAIIQRLDTAVSRLGKANMGYQSVTSSLELDTLKKERNRVSREIHDTVGYSLTNVRIMLEAAQLIRESNPEKADQLIRKSMQEAASCLEETRSAMRQLRSKEVQKPRGIKAFFHLVNVFAEATGVQVNLEFGNIPDSFGNRIDKAIFRFIQEGLTNSFRHGRATEIRIYFWIESGILKVSLQDNGSGAEILTEGIGLAGMQERLSELGGRMIWQNLSDGFEISIIIPLSRGAI